MCETVFADTILALLLSKQDRVRFRELKELRDGVERRHPDIIIEISAPTVQQAITHYPHVFSRQGDAITRAPKSRQFFREPYLRDEFLSRIPTDAVQAIEEDRASR